MTYNILKNHLALDESPVKSQVKTRYCKCTKRIMLVVHKTRHRRFQHCIFSFMFATRGGVCFCCCFCCKLPFASLTMCLFVSVALLTLNMLPKKSCYCFYAEMWAPGC